MKRESFNHNWTYHKQGSNDLISVTLPHDAMIHDIRDNNSPGTHANAFFTGGVYIYEKVFMAPVEWKGKHILLEFGGIYRNSSIFVNGKKAGGRPYGYVPFTVCLDSFLNYGQSNMIRVVADNSELPNSRWYSGGGIYRPVSLIIGNQTHIEWQGVHITTTSILPASVRVETDANGGEITVEIRDEGLLVASGCGAKVDLTIPNAKLWSDEAPYLYTCHVILRKGGEIVDEVTEAFGVRTIAWSPESGLLVNEKETLLRGACIHHDNGVLGACSYIEAEERKVRILKENGYNAIRMAHNPPSRLLLDACDRYGMYVMDETFDMWYYHKNKYDYASDFHEWHLEDAGAMVRQDYNHPSVILYSIGNEISEPYKEEGIQTAREMIDYIHSLDSTRAVTGGINLMIINLASQGKGIYKEDGGLSAEDKIEKKKTRDAGKRKKDTQQTSGSLFFNLMMSLYGGRMNSMANGKKADRVTTPILDALDIAGYNYASGRYPLEGKKHPKRIIVGSETFPMDIAKNWEMVKQYPYLIGDFAWTGWDYLGEAALGSWNYEGVNLSHVPYPWLIAECGVIDITGYAGAQAAYAKTVWGKATKPYIGVRPPNHPGERLSKGVWRGTNAFDSWSWKNCENNPAVVEVYADAAYVKLYINGKCIGKKKIKAYKCVFKTNYQPGEVIAEAYAKDGNLVGTASLKSANGETELKLIPEASQAKVGNVVFVHALLVGENDIVESNDDRKIQINVDNGELLGFGSAVPKSTDSFDSGIYSTYYGRALAVVRATGRGVLRVCAESGKLKAEAAITVDQKEEENNETM